MASNSLVRSQSDKVIAGVCGGLARSFGVDANIVRIGFVLAAIFTQVGWIAYILLWLFLPSEDSGETGLNNLRRQFGSQ